MMILLNALAEPNRLHIIELLQEGPRPVNELVEHLGLSQPLVSKHLRVLTQAGLVKVRPNAQQRIYQLEPAGFKEMDLWLEPFRALWESRLDQLQDYLQAVKKSQDTSKGDGA